VNDDGVGDRQVERFLQPLADAQQPCGPDLEYDNAFLELTQAAAGKPETQFAPGTPPDWRAVMERAEALFERTRDVRVAVLWTRAGVHLHGFRALPQGLRLVHGLLDQLWDTVHPLPDPDDGDPYARMNALTVLAQPDGLLGDLRQSSLFELRGVGELKVRAVEVALGLAPPRDDEQALSRAQLARMLEDAAAQSPALRELPAAVLQQTSALIALINERAGIEHAADLKPLHTLLGVVAGAMPLENTGGDPAAGAALDAAAAGGGPVPVGAGLSGGVRTREEAVRAIDMVCEYLERTEPTNPAPLLLRRARRLINHNFLQLMKELAPDALSEVARVMGVDPETVQIDDSS
jgi:type VI secretion system protein ImpA